MNILINFLKDGILLWKGFNNKFDYKYVTDVHRWIKSHNYSSTLLSKSCDIGSRSRTIIVNLRLYISIIKFGDYTQNEGNYSIKKAWNNL